MALKAMRELPDYVMAPGSPDVEGWQVHDRDDQVVGTVVDLLVDTRRDEVRYLAVQLTSGRSVLLPMGDLDLDEANGILRTVDRAKADLADLPEYTPPSLSAEVEERYYILFRREEPAGASDMSPLDYRIPPFRARGDRMESLVRGPRRSQGEPAGEPTPEPARREEGRQAEERRARPGLPVKGMPGAGPGLLAANDPWDLKDLPKEKGAKARGEFDSLGPDADREALWQSEQPGVTSALGAKRDLPEEKR